jgi:hypothetical protein
MCKHCNVHEQQLFTDMFYRAARVVMGDTYVRGRDEHGNRTYVQTYEGRAWFKREHDKHQFHPAVHDSFLTYRPDNWHQLLLEWPHKSVTDPNRVAYTENERKGEADRQTITTLGKYLRRHFQAMPDHELRDIVARHTYSGGIEIVDDLPNMIEAVMNGPSSCMTRHFDIRCDDGKRRHPYAVYDPSLGWSMAVRVQDGKILGRCLIYTDPDSGYKCFVRSYKRDPEQRSHSGVDEAIEAYLKNLGIEKTSEWPDGAKLMRYRIDDNEFLAPYIDGHSRHVDIYNDQYLTISSHGEYCCDNTDGRAGAPLCTCEDCGTAIYEEDDEYCVGRFADTTVCCNCIDNYTYVYGRRGNQYHVHNDYTVFADDDYYDEDYLDDNNIVQLEDGDYTHTDNAICVGHAWYRDDSDDICYAEDIEEHALREDCWTCASTAKWYTQAVDYVEVDGETYHPDEAPESQDNE